MDPDLAESAQNCQPGSIMDEFLTVLAVCNTVIPRMDSEGNSRYEAESPDEGALVEAATMVHKKKIL